MGKHGLTLTDAIAHASRHGYQLKPPPGKGGAVTGSDQGRSEPKNKAPALPQPIKMSRPEREMGMMLEAQKRNAEIKDYKFQGMSLAYSEDPETGILLRYKCDYVVIMWENGIKIIECKGDGKHAISAAAKLRFKGAKSAWPMFQFEMHQREKSGTWRRVL